MRRDAIPAHLRPVRIVHAYPNLIDAQLANARLARQPRAADTTMSDRQLAVIQLIAAAAGPHGMVGGQAIDLASVTVDALGRPPAPLDADGLRAMHGKKTGAMIRASATAGAIFYADAVRAL